MACKFSCFLNYSDAFKVNEGIFQSDNGNQYKIQYKSNVCRDLLLKIEWTVPKQVLVNVKLYNTSVKRCFSSKGIVVNGNKALMKLRGAFNISKILDYKVLCMINLIPYVKLIKYNGLPSEPMDSGFTEPESLCLSVEGRGAVIDEKIIPTKKDIEESRDVSNNSATNMRDINITSERKNSVPVMDNRHQKCLSVENDNVVDKNALTNDIKMKEFNARTSEDYTSDEFKSEMPKTFRAAGVEFQSLLVNKERGYLRDAEEKGTNFKEINTESNSISKSNYKALEKDFSILPNCDTFSHTHNADSLKMHNIQSSIVRSESPSINIDKTSSVIEESRIYNRVADNHKSASRNSQTLKTCLIFQTLVRKLSAEDSILELKDASKEVAGSSKIWTKNSPESNILSEKIYPVMESEFKGLSMDMLDLLTSSDMADAVITNGEKDLKVHRNIVSARSSVLKEAFTEHMQDDLKYRVIADIPSCIFEDVVTFLYVGIIYITSREMADELYQVAERYSINDLMDICSKHTSQ